MHIVLVLVALVEIYIVGRIILHEIVEHRKFKLRQLEILEGGMGQEHYAVYMLAGEPNTFVYTSTKCPNTLALLKDLGFKHQYTAYAYGWSCTAGHLYSIPKYFDVEDGDRMLKLVRMHNGTDTKIREIHKEICSIKVTVGKRWWQQYGTKK